MLESSFSQRFADQLVFRDTRTSDQDRTTHLVECFDVSNKRLDLA